MQAGQEDPQDLDLVSEINMLADQISKSEISSRGPAET